MEIWKALQEKTKEFRWSRLVRPVFQWLGQFHWLAIGLVVALVLLGYTNLVIYRFSPKDQSVLANNPQIRDPFRLLDFFTAATSRDELAGTTYRPVATLSLAVENLCGGVDPIGCRHTNVTLHAICGLLVYWLVWQLAAHRGFACAVAVLFAIHPLATSTVSYLATRGELLATLASLASLNLFLRARHWSGIDRFILGVFSLIAFAVALFSAESALLVPALVLAYLIAFERASGWKRWSWLAGFVALEAGYLVVRYRVLGGWGWIAGPDWELSDRFDLFLRSVGAASRLLFSPSEVPLDRTLVDVGTRWLTAYFGLGVLVVVILAAVLWYCRKNLPEPWFGAAWALVGLLPLWELESRTGIVAESWLYFASIGIWLVCASLAVLFLHRRKHLKVWRWIIVSAVCLVIWWFDDRTITRVNDWHSDTMPLAQSLVKTRPAALYHYQLGLAMVHQDRITNAVEQLEIARRIDPTLASVYTPLAILLSKDKTSDDAIDRIRLALQAEPTNVTLYVQMADVLLKKKQIADALPYLTAAASAPSPDGWACRNLAWILATSTNDAIRNGATSLKWAKRALELAGPKDVDSLDALAAAHAEIGNWTEATKYAAAAADLANQHGQGSKAHAIRLRYGEYTQHKPYREED